LILLGGDICLLFYQVFGWLQTGYWQPMTMVDGLRALSVRPLVVEWIGIQKTLDWVGSWPLSIVLLITGLFFASGFYLMLQDVKGPARRHR